MEGYITTQEIVQHYQGQERYIAVRFLKAEKAAHVKFVDKNKVVGEYETFPLFILYVITTFLFFYIYPTTDLLPPHTHKLLKSMILSFQYLYHPCTLQS